MRLDRVAPEALFVVSGISQYAGAAIAVLTFEALSPTGVAWWRVLGAGLIIVMLRRSWARGWDRRSLVLAGAFGIALAAMNMTFYLSIDRLHLGNAVAIEFIGPTVVAALGARTRRSWLALLLVAAGVVVLADVQWELDPLGVVFALLSASFWAGYIVLGARVASEGGDVDGLGVGMLIGALAIAPFGAPDGLAALVTPWVVGLALATAVLSNVIPYGLDQVILKRLARHRFALLLALLPVTATLTGLVALRQVPTVVEVFGIALVVVGLAASDRAEGVTEGPEGA
jgi:inner membrane transporter RhtA